MRISHKRKEKRGKKTGQRENRKQIKNMEFEDLRTTNVPHFAWAKRGSSRRVPRRSFLCGRVLADSRAALAAESPPAVVGQMAAALRAETVPNPRLTPVAMGPRLAGGRVELRPGLSSGRRTVRRPGRGRHVLGLQAEARLEAHVELRVQVRRCCLRPCVGLWVRLRIRLRDAHFHRCWRDLRDSGPERGCRGPPMPHRSGLRRRASVLGEPVWHQDQCSVSKMALRFRRRSLRRSERGGANGKSRNCPARPAIVMPQPN